MSDIELLDETVYADNLPVKSWKNFMRKPREKELVTHCKKGHLYTEKNTRTWMKGKKLYRCCRMCENIRATAMRARKRAAT